MDNINYIELTKKSRNINIDILRVICAIAVILIHANVIYIENIENNVRFVWSISNIIFICSRFAVPIFFMISGYLTLNNDKNVNIKEFYTKKFKKLVIPFLIWTIIYIIYDCIKYYEKLNVILILKKFLLSMAGAEAYYHLWFFYALIGMYLISPILIKLLKVLSNNDIVIILILFFIQNSIISVLQGIINYNSQWSIALAQSGLVYYILGGFIGKVGVYKLKEYKKFIYVISIISIIASIILSYIYTAINHNVIPFLSDRSFFTAAITSLAVFIFIMDIQFNNISNKVESFIFGIAKLGLGVYLIHPIVIEYIQRFIFNKSILSMIIEFIFSIIISYVLTYIINKIPILNNILP